MSEAEDGVIMHIRGAEYFLTALLGGLKLELGKLFKSLFQ